MTETIVTSKHQAVRDVVDTIASHPEGMTTRQLYEKYKGYLADAGLIDETQAIAAISKRISTMGLPFTVDQTGARRYSMPFEKHQNPLMEAVRSEPPAIYDVAEIDLKSKGDLQPDAAPLDAFFTAIFAAADHYRSSLERQQPPAIPPCHLAELPTIAAALRPLRQDWADVLDDIYSLCKPSGMPS